MFLITCGADGMVLYDWMSGVCITPEGAQAIDLQPMVGACPICLDEDVDLRNGVCVQCFLEGPDHDDD